MLDAKSGEMRGPDSALRRGPGRCNRPGPWKPLEFAVEYVNSLDQQARTKRRRSVELSYREDESDGARSFAATAWVVKGRVAY
jgi:hypothetical protein